VRAIAANCLRDIADLKRLWESLKGLYRLKDRLEGQDFIQELFVLADDGQLAVSVLMHYVQRGRRRLVEANGPDLLVRRKQILKCDIHARPPFASPNRPQRHLTTTIADYESFLHPQLPKQKRIHIGELFDLLGHWLACS